MLHISKRLSILLLIFLVTGCKADYSITINDTKDVNESLNIIETDSTLFDKKYEEFYNSTLREYVDTNIKWPTPIYIDSDENPIEPAQIEGVLYYNKKNISNKNRLGVNYSYKFDNNKYTESNILRSCYDYEFETINNVITFKTTSNFRCFEKYSMLKEANFILNTRCNVIDSNADEKQTNKYIWNITRDKQIKFSIDCNEKKSKEDIPATILLPIYLLLIGIGIIILKISYKFKNKL